ncbi:MAG TPA: hypothetical protein VN231_02395 [Allosphingosinicella sp.]|nr:hypothetical protein [Allosphingosinicella sp.]
MRRQAILFLTGLSMPFLFIGTGQSHGGACFACSVYEEYGMGAFRVGDVYRLWDGRLVRIQAVDSASRMIQVSLADGGSAERSWITASSVYTDQRWNERGEQRNQVGHAASCALYAQALRERSLWAAVFRGACCESSQARRDGRPAICR